MLTAGVDAQRSKRDRQRLVLDAGNDSNLLIVFYVQRAFTDKQQIKRKAQSFD